MILNNEFPVKVNKIEFENQKHSFYNKMNMMSQNIFENNNCVILCDGVEYTPNCGGILRNFGLLGGDLVIYCNDKKYNKIFRKNISHYSMNNPSNIKVMYNLDINSVLMSAIFNQYKIIVLETEGSSIFKSDLSSDKILFIVGNERYGIGKQVQLCIQKGFAEKISIPTTTSLNVAHAATLAIYERKRQLSK